MKNTDERLNLEASTNEEYFKKRTGIQLEEDVYNILVKMAEHTPFEGSIRLVSGASFPDIIASGYYGVEVKSTIKNQWKSIGSSILESTRDQNVERIYLTFGKLGSPVEFRSRPYEECLSGISVTHYPRYQIDMELEAGETIFDKMGIEYDVLRKMENPVTPVSKYYRSRLKPGESLWWATDSEAEEGSVPPTVKLWSALTPEEKMLFTIQGYVLFPEIIGDNHSSKYQRFALWLATHCGVVNTNIRDQFSAGGKVDICVDGKTFANVSAVFGRINRYKEQIIFEILSTEPQLLQEFWKVRTIKDNRVKQWCEIAASYCPCSNKGQEKIFELLSAIMWQ